MKIEENESLRYKIGERINNIRIEKGMSKEEFASFINICGQHLGRVIRGEAGLSVEKIIEVSKKTGYSTDYILLGKKNSLDKVSKDKIELAENQLKTAYNTLKTFF